MRYKIAPCSEHLGWGSDTHLYRSTAEFGVAFPRRLQSSGPRVIKQNRGNGGQGVWKVEQISTRTDAVETVRVLHAQRGSIPEDLSLQEFMARCEPYFASGGCIIDQPFQPRLPDGMIRCYMGTDEVVGFGHQLIKALTTAPRRTGLTSCAARPAHYARRRCGSVSSAAGEDGDRVDAANNGGAGGRPPITANIWDSDFLYGAKTASGQDSYVLCEINVSSCFSIPEQAPAAIARLVLNRLSNARQ